MKNILILDRDSVAVEIFKKMFSELRVNILDSWNRASINDMPEPDVVIYDMGALGGSVNELFKLYGEKKILLVDCSDDSNNSYIERKAVVPHLLLSKPIVPDIFYSKVRTNYDSLVDRKTSINDVIIVDDNEHQRERLKRLLNDSFSVTTFSSAITALQHIKTNSNPMVIVLDIMMENMNGFEFLKNLREEQDRNTPVLCLSSKRIHRFVDQAIALGANEYMFKPYNAYRLKRVVTMLANGS